MIDKIINIIDVILIIQALLFPFLLWYNIFYALILITIMSIIGAIALILQFLQFLISALYIIEHITEE